jgi:hypothetical protein
LEQTLRPAEPFKLAKAYVDLTLTEWRRMQSRANSFSGPNSLLTGENTGNLTPNVAVVACKPLLKKKLEGKTGLRAHQSEQRKNPAYQGIAIR